MTQDIMLADAAATDRLGVLLAAQLHAPALVLLEGDLGAGKTQLARAVVRTLTGDDKAEVPSPTFTLLQTYESSRGPLYHYDLYRLQQADEVYELDWETALAEAVTLVEWPSRLGSLRPANAKIVHMRIDHHARSATLDGFGYVAF